MGKLRMLWARVKGQAAQGREDEVFDEEMREHIALLEERYTAQGMSARDAARAARRQFGNVTVLKERQRAQRGILSPAEWWRDVRFGMRMLAKRPVSNAAVVLALALGIGMNSAVFTFVNALLLRPPQGVSANQQAGGGVAAQPEEQRRSGLFAFQLSRLRLLSRPYEIAGRADGVRWRRQGCDLESRRARERFCMGSWFPGICFHCWE